MTVHYIDPSAWVKRHFQEAGSESVNALFRASIDAACCQLGLVEMLATVVRKCSQSAVESSVVNTIVDNVRADFAATRSVKLDDALIASATDLALRHRLRAMDAVHLASALTLRPLGEVVMVSADAELVTAAAKEAMKTLDPAASSA